MKTDKLVAIIAVIAVASILIGEAYVSAFDADSAYGSDAELNGSGVSYSVTSDTSTQYDVTVIFNGDWTPATDVYVYYDTTRAEALEDVWHAYGGKELTQEYYVEQLMEQLDSRGVDASTVDAEELADIMTNGDASDTAVIFVSGALPSTVYNGTSSCTILTWIQNGGTLYWVGNMLGLYIAEEDGSLTTVTADYQYLFFGVSDCLYTEDEKAYDAVGNSLYDDLKLSDFSVRYGIDADLLESGTYLQLGYEKDGVADITLVQRGSGMICVLGGDYSNNQRSDLATVIASGLSYQSEEAGHASGDIDSETVDGTIEFAEETGSYSVYVALGGYFTTYGQAHYLTRT